MLIFFFTPSLTGHPSSTLAFKRRDVFYEQPSVPPPPIEIVPGNYHAGTTLSMSELHPYQTSPSGFLPLRLTNGARESHCSRVRSHFLARKKGSHSCTIDWAPIIFFTPTSRSARRRFFY